jgi:hypothetical protein
MVGGETDTSPATTADLATASIIRRRVKLTEGVRQPEGNIPFCHFLKQQTEAGANYHGWAIASWPTTGLPVNQP